MIDLSDQEMTVFSSLDAIIVCLVIDSSHFAFYTLHNQEIRSNFSFIINTYLRALKAISRACSGYPKGRLCFLKVLS